MPIWCSAYKLILPSWILIICDCAIIWICFLINASDVYMCHLSKCNYPSMNVHWPWNSSCKSMSISSSWNLTVLLSNGNQTAAHDDSLSSMSMVLFTIIDPSSVRGVGERYILLCFVVPYTWSDLHVQVFLSSVWIRRWNEYNFDRRTLAYVHHGWTRCSNERWRFRLDIREHSKSMDCSHLYTHATLQRVRRNNHRCGYVFPRTIHLYWMNTLANSLVPPSVTSVFRRFIQALFITHGEADLNIMGHLVRRSD